MLKATTPRSKKDQRSIVMFCSIYKRFMKKIAEIENIHVPFEGGAHNGLDSKMCTTAISDSDVISSSDVQLQRERRR